MSQVNSILVTAHKDLDFYAFGDWLQDRVDAGVNVVIAYPASSKVPHGRFRSPLTPMSEVAADNGLKWTKIKHDHCLFEGIGEA